MRKLSFIQTTLILTTAIQMGCTTTMKDQFQWLEDVDAKKSMDWVQKKNDLSVKHFSDREDFPKIESDALKIMDNKDRIPMISFFGDSVYNFWTDNKNPRGLYRRTSFESYKTKNPKWEIVLDVDALNKKEGKSWVFRGCHTFKPDFSRCLIALSDAGRDAAEMREFDLKTKTFVTGGFQLPVGKNRHEWLDENTLLIAVDSDPKTVSSSGYPMQVKLWKRGTPSSEAKVIYTAEPNDMGVYISTQCRPEGCRSVIFRAISFYETDTFFVDTKGGLQKVDLPPVYEFQGFFKGDFYVQLNKDLNLGQKTFVKGSLLKAPIGNWQYLTAVFTPAEKQALQYMRFSKDHIYLSILENVVPKVYRDGVVAPVPALGNASIAEVDEFSNRTLLNFESPLMPPTLFQWEGNQLITLKKLPAQFNAENLSIEQLEATSKDGTKVPYFLIRSKFSRGPAPTIVSAYGGFQIPIIPSYEPIRGKLWLEKGGQLVVANIRGGGEFGPRWHEAALKENRQKAFDDLFAVTEDLYNKALTTPAMTGMVGGSNGGLLAGVAYTQKPELFKAIVSQVPLLDMKRYNKLLAGSSWMAEYGNPDDPKDWSYISKYSPYHNLKMGKNYPALFLMTSTRDDRVHPGHARKFGARLEEMKVPFFYFENIEGGHGAAADLKQRAKFVALQYAFFLEQLQ